MCTTLFDLKSITQGTLYPSNLAGKTNNQGLPNHIISITPTKMAEATPSTAAPVAATETKSSVEQTIEKTKSDPRFTRGLALLKEKRYEEAIVIFEDMLRTMYDHVHTCVFYRQHIHT